MNTEDIRLRCSTLYLHTKRPKIPNHQIYSSETWTANANVRSTLKQIISKHYRRDLYFTTAILQELIESRFKFALCKFRQILNEFALPAHVGILILDRMEGLCRIINSSTVTRFYYYFVFVLGAERLKTDGKIRNIIDLFFFGQTSILAQTRSLKSGRSSPCFLANLS